jgi:hypothetical protein
MNVKRGGEICLAYLAAACLAGCSSAAPDGASPAHDGTAGSTSNAAVRCDGASPCGGSLDGSWQIDSTCFEGDLAAVLNSYQPAACATAFRSATVAMNGTVAYANGTENLNGALNLDLVATYTSDCINVLTGSAATLDAATCAVFRPSLPQPNAPMVDVVSGSCSLSNTGCDCAASMSMAPRSFVTAAYTISGSRFVYKDAPGFTDYCVSGTTLTEYQVVGWLKSATVVTTLHRVP